jgi:hypothetical protein
MREIPRSWQEALGLWDEDVPVYTIELGGAGPSYEQAMHIGVFEALRRIGDIDTDLHTDTQHIVIVRALQDIDTEFRLKLSQEQTESASLFLLRVLKRGWLESIVAYPTDRQIQVCRWYPGK